MAVVKAFADVPNPRVTRTLKTGETSCRTTFFDAPEEGAGDIRMAFLVEGQPNRVGPTHFHTVDQFQVIWSGDGTLGSHGLKFGGVHFARAYTPYGPIRNGKQGLGFLTLRAHFDPGSQYLSKHRETLKSIPNRQPWQITTLADFNVRPGEDGVAVTAIEGLRDERGLAGYSVVLKQGATAQAADPTAGDGQYILVMRGGIIHEGQLKQALTIIWVDRNEPPFQLVAGPDGCEVLVLNFPVPGAGAAAKARIESAPAGDSKAYHCALCDYIYDEAAGCPEAGIAPGTRWADVPESFKCPDCEATKADFESVDF